MDLFKTAAVPNAVSQNAEVNSNGNGGNDGGDSSKKDSVEKVSSDKVDTGTRLSEEDVEEK